MPTSSEQEAKAARRGESLLNCRDEKLVRHGPMLIATSDLAGPSLLQVVILGSPGALQSLPLLSLLLGVEVVLCAKARTSSNCSLRTPIPTSCPLSEGPVYFFWCSACCVLWMSKGWQGNPIVRAGRAASALCVSCSVFVLAASVSGGSATPPRHERLEALHCPLTPKPWSVVGHQRISKMAQRGVETWLQKRGADLQNPKPRHRVNRIGFRGGGTQAVAGH